MKLSKSNINRLMFVDEVTKLECVIVKHYSHDHFNGYVGVSISSKYHGIDYHDINIGIDVTYSDHYIPRVFQPSDGTWYIGFSCMDYIKNINHAIDKCSELAEALSK